MDDFRDGDTVRCNTAQYEGVRLGELRVVCEVIRREGYMTLLRLRNPRSPIGFSNFDASQFKVVSRHTSTPKEDKSMERIKFFAVKLDLTQTADHSDGLCLVENPGGFDTTPLRDSRHQVQIDVQKKIAEGDQWLVVSTVQKMEGLAPRPPVQITEYK